MNALRRLTPLPLLLSLLLPLPALSEEQIAYRTHPEFATRRASLRSVAIAPVELKLYELTAGDKPVFHQDWSDQGRESVTAGLEAVLRVRGFEVKRLGPLDPGGTAQLAEVTRLFHAVAAGVIQATYANKFPAKVARFEYALGDLGPLLDRQPADAVLFAFGTGNISSGGRVATQAMLSLLTGQHSVGVDRLLVGVVDRRGDLLWFGTFVSTSSDLRNPDSAGGFVEALARDLPPVKR